jgi:hypothetical protein
MWYPSTWLVLWGIIHHVSCMFYTVSVQFEAALSLCVSLHVGQTMAAYVLYIVKCILVWNSAVWILLPVSLCCNPIIFNAEILYHMPVVIYLICKCHCVLNDSSVRECMTTPAKTKKWSENWKVSVTPAAYCSVMVDQG